MKRMKHRSDVGGSVVGGSVVLKVSPVALFCTLWSLERSYLEQSAKSELQ